MYTFRFLHLSDYHFASNNPVFRPRFSEGRAASASALALTLKDSLDAILVSGDLAHLGTHKDQSFAHDCLTADPFYDLTRCQVPLLLVPGNHDRFMHFSRKPGNTVFDSVFRNFWGASDHTSHGIFRAQGGETVGFVFADFCLKSLQSSGDPRSYLGCGCAYKERLNFLERWTAKLFRNEECDAVFWVIHFAPGYPGIDKKLLLENDEELLKIAARHSVSGILCGHTHKHLEYSPDRYPDVRVYCAGAVCAFALHDYFVPDKSSVHLLEVCVDGSKKNVRWLTGIWSDRLKAFSFEQ